MAETSTESFGGLIRRYRRRAGLTQEELAERAELSPRGLIYLERNERRPHPGTVKRLADVLNLAGEERQALLAAGEKGHQPQGVTLPEGQGVGAPAPATTHPTNLPEGPTPFIGREREIARVAMLFRHPAIRLATLTGPGGIGKTRLALQVGATLLHGFQDGVFFVNLASLADASLVAPSIAAVLDVAERAEINPLDALTEHIKEKHLLLVLDNFEHLLDAAPLVSALLDDCRDLHILVTSRIPLHLSREHEYSVPPLPLPDTHNLPDPESLSQYEAVALLIERARAVKPDFSVTDENAPAVAEICVQLDGLPLAIELAAARLKFFPPQALLQRLHSRLALLTGGARDRPTRQQTLRGAIDWSYSLLSQSERTLFARLSVFAGGCTLEAAEAVCNPDGDLDVLEGMVSLVDKSLLRQEGEGEARFAMLETIREYAAEKFADSSAIPVRDAHARYFVKTLTETAQEKWGWRMAEFFRILEADVNNLRTAEEWLLENGQCNDAFALAADLSGFWYNRGSRNECLRWLERSIANPAAMTPEKRAQALYTLAGWKDVADRNDEAELLLNEALDLFDEMRDRKGRARVLSSLSHMALVRGDGKQAGGLAEDSLAIFRELGDIGGLWMALSRLGTIAGVQGDYPLARRYLEEDLEIAHRGGNPTQVATTLINLGWIALSEERLSDAEELLQEARAIATGLEWKPNLAYALANLGDVSMERGDHSEANDRLTESLRLSLDLDNSDAMLMALLSMMRLAARTGDMEQAALLAGAVAALTDRQGHLGSPIERERHQQALDALRQGLDAARLDTLWRQGQAMSLRQAAEYAVGD